MTAINMQLAPTPSMWIGGVVTPPSSNVPLTGSDADAEITGSDADAPITGSD